jgi:Putative Ig domain
VGVDALDPRAVRYRLMLNPLTIRPTSASTTSFSFGGPLAVVAVRTTPRAATAFAPACQVMLYLQDSVGNLVRAVHKLDSSIMNLRPTVVVNSGGATSKPFDDFTDFFCAKLQQQFDRSDNPTYDITWDFGPWGTGHETGPLYGQEQRRMSIDETSLLLAQAPRLDRTLRSMQVEEYEQFAQIMQDQIGVPTDYKMGVISNIRVAGFEDEVQHGYKMEIGGFELSSPVGWKQGFYANDHEAGHGRIHKPPSRFFAVSNFYEAYATLVGVKARAKLFGGDDFLKYMLGTYDLFLRHQHGVSLPTEGDYIEMMQFVTHYINSRHGWTPHRRMILEWDNSFRRIRSRLGTSRYTSIEQFAIVYSWLCGEDLEALFKASGLPVTDGRVASGVKLLKDYLNTFNTVSIDIGTNTVEAPQTSVSLELPAPISGATSFDATVSYDPMRVTVDKVYTRDLTSLPDWAVSADTTTPGKVVLYVSGRTPVDGVGTIAQINFSLRPNTPGGTVGFTLSNTKVNGRVVASVDGGLTIPDVPLIGPFPNFPDVTKQLPYSTSLWATGGHQPYSWSILEDVLPPGLVLDATTGEIYGTSAVGGEYLFRVECKDSRGKSAHVGLQSK